MQAQPRVPCMVVCRAHMQAQPRVPCGGVPQAGLVGLGPPQHAAGGDMLRGGMLGDKGMDDIGMVEDIGMVLLSGVTVLWCYGGLL